MLQPWRQDQVPYITMSFFKGIHIATILSIVSSLFAPRSLAIPYSFSSILLAYLATILLRSAWIVVLAPYFSPFTDLPSSDQGPWYTRFLTEPDPGDLENWINQIPNDGRPFLKHVQHNGV